MGNIVLNAAGLFAMIFLGYFLKRLNVLSKADGSILSKIILNVTLPAAIILNLASMQVQVSALSLIVIALIITIVQILFAFFLTKKEYGEQYHVGRGNDDFHRILDWKADDV